MNNSTVPNFQSIFYFKYNSSQLKTFYLYQTVTHNFIHEVISTVRGMSTSCHGQNPMSKKIEPVV